MVKRILGKFKGRFKLMYAMPAWKHRGLSTFKEGKLFRWAFCVNDRSDNENCKQRVIDPFTKLHKLVDKDGFAKFEVLYCIAKI